MLWMPTSKVTRVRSDGFSTMRAINLPCSVEAERTGRAFMSAERWRSSRVCVGLHSAPVSRSLDKEMGATRVVVVIFLPRCGVREARHGGSGLRGSSRNGFGSSCENGLEETEKFAHLRTGDDEGRQQAQSEIVGAIDD